MRIIAGSRKGARIFAPKGLETRPTADRVREAAFNLLGPGAAVLNSTELKPGDEVLGFLPGRERHVGYPIDELCHEL